MLIIILIAILLPLNIILLRSQDIVNNGLLAFVIGIIISSVIGPMTEGVRLNGIT